MEGTPAIYLGRIVEKKHFRAFIYSPNGEKRLAESWAEFEANMQTGLWFASVEDAMDSVAPVEEAEESKGNEMPKPKSKSKGKGQSKPKPVKVEEIEEDDGEILSDELDGAVFEVTDENK